MLQKVTYYDFAAQKAKQGIDWGRCSGSLIAPRWIVTAAHCLPNAEISDMVWRVGFRGFCPPAWRLNCGLEYADVGVDEVFAHEYVDVALVRLEEPAPANIEPVRVDSDGVATASLQTGDDVVALGTGRLSLSSKEGPVLPSVLQRARLRFESDDDVCHEHLGTELVYPSGFICSAAEDVDEEGGARTCYGDSGGPLIILGEITSTNDPGGNNETRSEDVLIGVVVVGDPWCRKNVAGFAEIFYVKDWICETMCSENWNKNSRMTKEKDRENENNVTEAVASDCPAWCREEDAGETLQPNDESSLGNMPLKGPSSAPSLQ